MFVRQDQFATGEVKLELSYGQKNATIVFTGAEIGVQAGDEKVAARGIAEALLGELAKAISDDFAAKRVHWSGI
jgi:hypothetical protein